MCCPKADKKAEELEQAAKKAEADAREELKKAQKENDDKRDKLEKVRQPCAALASSLSVAPVLHAPPTNVT